MSQIQVGMTSGYIACETRKAIQVNPSADGSGEGVWLPKSQIEIRRERVSPTTVWITITMPHWLAADRGLLDYSNCGQPENRLVCR